jgi:predicted signal transduction protein with EAL and GGDEF domain
VSVDMQIARYRSLVARLEQKIQSLTGDLHVSNTRLEVANRQLIAVALNEQKALNTQVRHRLSLEADMRRALAADEFTIHYQPLIDIATRRVTSLEALVRWNHPTRGPISPGEFIPVAEESDLILSLGEHVLRTVCRQVVHGLLSFLSR